MVEELARAARDVGFVTLIGHGVSPELVQKAAARAREFFALPPAARMRLARRSDNPSNKNAYTGYFPATLHGKHGLDLGNVLPGAEDHFKLYGRRLPLEEEQSWPEEAAEGEEPTEGQVRAGWQTDVREYYSAMQTLGSELMDAFGMALGLADGGLSRQMGTRWYHENFNAAGKPDSPPLSTLRFNFYPSMSEEEANKLDFNVSSAWG